ncbi:MAG: helix-turn-helix domain-containing protein [Clostridium sp.]|nr:helix-turn-helix domain-containing protein [Clostridium sp.]
MIDIHTILEKLTVSGLERIHPSDRSYSLAVRNEHAVNLGNPSIIHVLTAREFEHAESGLSGACFIVGKPSPLRIPEEMEAVIFPEFVPADTLLESCNHIISEYRRFCAYKAKLELMIQTKQKFPSVFQVFSDFYDNPVCFGDNGGSVLFFANLREDYDSYDESIRYWATQGHVPYEYSRKHGNTEGAARVAASPVPVIMDTGYASRFRRMSYRTCKVQNHYNNYLCVVEAHHPYLPFDRDALIYTADLVSGAFTPESLNQIESPRNHVLRSLLEGKIQSQEAMSDRMQRCHISDSRFCLVAVISLRSNSDLGQSDSDFEKLVYLRNMLNNTEPMILQIIREQELILLIQAQKAEDYQSKLDKLTSCLQEEPTLYMSYSRPFSAMLETPGKYTEAHLAYEIGAGLFPDRPVYSFSELYLPILLSLAGKETDLRQFLVDGLIQLYRLDRQKNTEYFRTLQEYLACNMNILECAKKLHIHRNTAIYRLNKAKQSVDADFNCFDDIVKLYLSIQYIDFLLSAEEDSGSAGTVSFSKTTEKCGQ